MNISYDITNGNAISINITVKLIGKKHRTLKINKYNINKNKENFNEKPEEEPIKMDFNEKPEEEPLKMDYDDKVKEEDKETKRSIIKKINIINPELKNLYSMKKGKLLELYKKLQNGDYNNKLCINETKRSIIKKINTIKPELKNLYNKRKRELLELYNKLKND